MNERIQVLQILYVECSSRAKMLSHRQYDVTSKIIWLHLAIIAAGIASPATFGPKHTALTILALVVFDGLAITYIYKKASSYWRNMSNRAHLLNHLSKHVNLAREEGQALLEMKSRTIADSEDPTLKGTAGSATFIAAMAISFGVTALILVLG